VSFLTPLDLAPLGDGRYRGGHGETSQEVVFGGQLLAQTIMAAARTVPDKDVRSVHTIFARGASTAAPIDLDVEVMHSGRAFASATVTVRQPERLCSRSLVLLDAAEPDLIRHGAPMPPVAGPGEPSEPAPGWEVSTVGGVDISDPSGVGPAELFVWTRFPGVPGDPTTGQACLAYATDGFLIGTAMRPHPGVGQALAHVSISTTVLTHTLTFHEPFDASDWLLLAQESPYAGRGRSYGRALVYTADGRLVASFVQDNMIRDFPASQRPSAGEKSRF
jgi:acyl-CoA thioesterase-2